jgi:hypothetical protein
VGGFSPNLQFSTRASRVWVASGKQMFRADSR